MRRKRRRHDNELRELIRILRWIIRHWKLVVPSLILSTNLSKTSGQTGDTFDFVVTANQGGQPAVNEPVTVTITAPDGTTSQATGSTDNNGQFTVPQTAGQLVGAYQYNAVVAGETAPAATFTQLYSISIVHESLCANELSTWDILTVSLY